MAGPLFEHPYYPIIYVRGYAGTDSDIEDTVSDPYMGFNLGSTRIRTLWTGDTERYYFESPLVRLMKDFKYTDVYSAGLNNTENHSPFFRGEIHFRPRRPLPFCWDSANTTTPSFAPSRASFSAISFVEVVSSNTRMSRPTNLVLPNRANRSSA